MSSVIYFSLGLAGLLVVPNALADELKQARPTTPKAVVLQYLALDARGAALTDEGRESLQRLAAVPIGEPVNGPTIKYVITDYGISSTKVGTDSAVVTVEYRLIGKLVNDVNFEPQMEVRRQEIKLINKGGTWYINTTQWPYVSWQTVISDMKAEQDKSREHEERIADRRQREYYRATRTDYLRRSNQTINEIRELGKRSQSD